MGITKAQELAVIDKAIAKLGEQSYLGPWLKGIRHELEAFIKSDLPISADTPAEAQRYVQEIKAAGRDERDRLIQEGQSRREQVIVAARADAQRLRDEARRDLGDALARVRRALEAL